MMSTRNASAYDFFCAENDVICSPVGHAGELEQTKIPSVVKNGMEGNKFLKWLNTEKKICA